MPVTLKYYQKKFHLFIDIFINEIFWNIYFPANDLISTD